MELFFMCKIPKLFTLICFQRFMQCSAVVCKIINNEQRSFQEDILSSSDTEYHYLKWEVEWNIAITSWEHTSTILRKENSFQ